jgi:hypothetical protein
MYNVCAHKGGMYGFVRAPQRQIGSCVEKMEVFYALAAPRLVRDVTRECTGLCARNGVRA